jgi:hypothetical protein
MKPWAFDAKFSISPSTLRFEAQFSPANSNAIPACRTLLASCYSRLLMTTKYPFHFSKAMGQYYWPRAREVPRARRICSAPAA